MTTTTDRAKKPDKELLYTGFEKLPATLKELGYDALREGQDEAVMSILFGKDTLCVLPTGFGKSAIYITPTRALDWKALIFSPLISLMQDQVEALWGYGFSAGQISSSQSLTENNTSLSEWERGDLQFMLVAPERLKNERFMEVISRMKPNLVVVDEAHCVSQWADSFRPDYLKIGDFITENSPDCVLALTATLTSDMETEVRTALSIQGADKIVYYPERKNLSFHYDNYDLSKLRHRINSIKGPVIVYCSTKKLTHELFDCLRGQIDGECLVYNGGMKPDERTTNQNLFMSNKVRVMFATNAFGLGVNKPDIRGVIHIGYPGSIEQYVQEAGRAGRDGGESSCVLFGNSDSLATQQWFIETTFPTENEIRMVYSKVKSLADSAGIVRLTIIDLAKHTGLHAATVTSALGVMSGYKVVDRNLSIKKTAKIRILKEHFDEKYSSILSDVEKFGFLEGKFYDVDLTYFAETRGVKVASILKDFRDLNNAGYIMYVPPFNGKPTKLIGNISLIDFTKLDEKRSEAFKKIDELVEFCQLSSSDKHTFLTDYFS
jgi:ATP-dependent DNA helicase RecQ